MTSDPRRQAMWDRAEIPHELRSTYSLSGLREVLGFVAPESTNVWSRGWRSGRSISDDGTTLWCVESVHFAHCVDLRRNMSRVQIGGSRVMHRVVGQIPWCPGVVLDGHGGGYLHDGDTLERRFRVIRGGAVGPLARCDARRLVALRGWSSGRGEETAITRVGRRHATALRVLPLGAPFAFSPSGDVFAGIAEKSLLRVMSIDAGDVLWEAPLPSRDAHAVAVADEGRAAFVVLATFDRDPTTRELRDHSLLCLERGGALRWQQPIAPREERTLSLVDGLLRESTDPAWRRPNDGCAEDVWRRIDTGDVVATPDGHPRGPRGARLPADDRTIRHVAGRYALVPRPPDEPLHSAGHDAAVTVVAPSPDGLHVAAADLRGRVAIHRLGAVIPERCLYVAEGAAVTALAWTRDGAALVVATATALALWELSGAGAASERTLVSLGFDAADAIQQIAVGAAGAGRAVVTVKKPSNEVVVCGLDLIAGVVRWRWLPSATAARALVLRRDGAAVRDELDAWRDVETGQRIAEPNDDAPEPFATRGAVGFTHARLTIRGTDQPPDRPGAAVEVRGARTIRLLPATATSAALFCDAEGERLLVGTMRHGVLVFDLERDGNTSP